FTDRQSTNDERLVDAIRMNRKVVLGADFRKYEKMPGGEPIFPLDEFHTNAVVGLAKMVRDRVDNIGRQIDPGTETLPTLPWAAAKLAGVPDAVFESRFKIERLLNYPSSVGQFHSITFSEVSAQEPGYFSNKFVFVGGSPEIKTVGELADEFPTPVGTLSGVF